MEQAERLARWVIVDYEAIAAGVETGRDKVHRTSLSGEKEDILLKPQTITGVLIPLQRGRGPLFFVCEILICRRCKPRCYV